MVLKANNFNHKNLLFYFFFVAFFFFNLFCETFLGFGGRQVRHTETADIYVRTYIYTYKIEGKKSQVKGSWINKATKEALAKY